MDQWKASDSCIQGVPVVPTEESRDSQTEAPIGRNDGKRYTKGHAHFPTLVHFLVQTAFPSVPNARLVYLFDATLKRKTHIFRLKKGQHIVCAKTGCGSRVNGYILHADS
jgi:hypothetical protein